MWTNEGQSVEITRKVILIGCLVGIGGMTVETYRGPLAAAHESGPYAGMKRGIIEGIAERSLCIGGDEFGIVEPLEITDQYKRPFLLKNLESGQEVYFQLDHKNRVNRMIVLIPS